MHAVVDRAAVGHVGDAASVLVDPADAVLEVRAVELLAEAATGGDVTAERSDDRILVELVPGDLVVVGARLDGRWIRAGDDRRAVRGEAALVRRREQLGAADGGHERIVGRRARRLDPAVAIAARLGRALVAAGREEGDPLARRILEDLVLLARRSSDRRSSRPRRSSARSRRRRCGRPPTSSPPGCPRRRWTWPGRARSWRRARWRAPTRRRGRSRPTSRPCCRRSASNGVRPCGASWWKTGVGQAEGGVERGQVVLDERVLERVDDDDRPAAAIEALRDELVESVGRPDLLRAVADDGGRTAIRLAPEHRVVRLAGGDLLQVDLDLVRTGACRRRG